MTNTKMPPALAKGTTDFLDDINRTSAPADEVVRWKSATIDNIEGDIQPREGFSQVTFAALAALEGSISSPENRRSLTMALQLADQGHRSSRHFVG